MGVVWHTFCHLLRRKNVRNMTDVDFIRLSALVFATELIGKTTDPINEGVEMAERLFNTLNLKEVQ